MATSTVLVDVAPRDVWAVLAQGEMYVRWSDGVLAIDAVEGPWPRRGARIRFTRGVGRFTFRAVMTSLHAVAPRRLQLETRAPFGRAHVDIQLSPVDGRTLIELTETVVSPAMVRRLSRPSGIRRRNDQALRRLARLAQATVED
jgi:hypothetical protein